MQRIKIHSSVIRSIGYDRATLTLEVEFKTGQIYRYRPVPRSKLEALKRAESKGRYFNANIRDRYSFVHV
jgi:KTSC domain